jgi:transglutaminase-like putative cysteine protease
MSTDRVSLERLLWTTACFALATFANLATLPAWVVVTAFAAGAIRLLLAARRRGPPPRPWRLLAAALTVAVLLAQFHSFNGITAGTALLCLMAGLKLLETRNHRDIHVVLLIVYFLSLAALLRSTSFWLLAYLIGVCWLTTATLLQLTVTQPGPEWRASLRHSGRILLHALPLALVLWLLFPRLSEPLWQIGDDGGGATSGLSDTMSPGDITDLALSEEIAFRVRFAAEPPPPESRYWRGPVLNDFDGSAWRRGDPGFFQPPKHLPTEPVFRYTISLEPYRHNWIYTLDRPVQWDLPHAALTGDYVLVQPDPVSRPIDIAATSTAGALMPGPLGEALRRRDLRLPSGRNPRTAQFARKMRSDHPDDRDYVRAVLAMLHDQAFYYTLSPPGLGADPVDEFLFDSRRGFCGHYASAFAVMMRAAGVPARVVTGYLGGKPNPYADYWIVRQSDAHAWVEVWIDGSGWMRIDPTAAIDSARVESRARAQDNATGRLGQQLSAHLPWLADLRLRIDALRQLWRERILQFDQNSQQSLLARLMIPEPDARKLVIVLAATLSLAFGWLTWQVRRELAPQIRDAAARAYARLCGKMARIGLARLPHEGAESYAARIATVRPDLGEAVTALVRQYTELRYGNHDSDAAIARFAAAVRAFRPRARR